MLKRILIFACMITFLGGVILPQSITVTSPNGGERWNKDGTYTITWTSERVSGDLRIQLYKDGRNLGRLESNVRNTGRYIWTIDALADGTAIRPGSRYAIRIEDMDRTISDISDDTFSIIQKSITVEYPNSYRDFKIGDDIRIAWRAENLTENVGIALQKNGRHYGNIVVNLHHGRISHYWEVGDLLGPTELEPGSGFKIVVFEQGTGISDTSDVAFDITRTGMGLGKRRCDFAIEDVTFADNRPLNRGVYHIPGSPCSARLKVKVRWNKISPTRPGSHVAEARSKLTNQTVHTRISPSNFSHLDADPDGRIFVIIEMNIHPGVVASMKRGRFIPMVFSFRVNPASGDSIARNNRKEMNLRILQPPSYDVEVRNSYTRTTKKSKSRRYNQVNYNIYFQVRNVTISEVSGKPKVVKNVPARLYVDRKDGRTWRRVKEQNITLHNVGGRWRQEKFQGSFQLLKNHWAPLRAIITLDPANTLHDPDRSDNEFTNEFTVR